MTEDFTFSGGTENGEHVTRTKLTFRGPSARSAFGTTPSGWRYAVAPGSLPVFALCLLFAAGQPVVPDR